jgi:hypothetical protein
MWEIKYSQEVRSYIYDSYPYTAMVWDVIKSLKNSSDGLPPTGAQLLELELYLWTVANHLVIYRRLIDERILRFAVVKSME